MRSNSVSLLLVLLAGTYSFPANHCLISQQYTCIYILLFPHLEGDTRIGNYVNVSDPSYLDANMAISLWTSTNSAIFV